MADTPARKLPRRVEDFVVLEAHPTAHLTDEQKSWPTASLTEAPSELVVLEAHPTGVQKSRPVTGPASAPRAAAERRLADAVRELLALGASPESLTEQVAKLGREAR